MSNSTDGNRPKMLLKLKDVMRMTGLSKSSIYNRMSSKSGYFDPTFPRQVSIGPRSVAWERTEIEEWIESRIKMREKA